MEKFFLYVLIITTLLNISGCGIQEERDSIEQPRYTIGAVLKSLDSEHWLAVRSGMLRAAQEYHVNVIVLYASNESAVAEQKQMIWDILGNQIDVLAVASCDLTQSEDYLEYAKSKNIPVFMIDERVEGIPYIGSNNYRIGQMAGAYLAEQMSGDGKIGIIMGNRRQNAHLERVAGLEDYLAQHTQIRIVDSRQADSDLRQASIQAEEMLANFSDIDGIFVTSARMALGAIESERVMKKAKIYVVGVDTQNDAILAMIQGRIAALVSQNGYEIGYLTIRSIVEGLDNQTLNRTAYIENNLITKDNAAQYLAPSNQ
ncbi:substrate-binding domain-containing protein|uniref:Monosaccharide ABC transporter substrate-binding protein, CUT2 family n=1 Tax=Dendrosporobacter quercicolus TaxID=146817 RepID=A0A1G9QL50_9FIRM|nr:substrate-binding domain-containing protein [Dendrosporobacter quercicolus]NSL48283.1 substrate-binding domain-containing protein [Dendrosporobacter quercicolus DSM 1736]SDM11738.1 monosaccharide ABC transporter substrate-binding protein, CUT2 family [Dendrosporobacter quercicolus]